MRDLSSNPVIGQRLKAIELQAVSKSFGSFAALKSVSFDIYQNEFFTMLGPSGCGKTTLLRMIAGFEHPTGGHIRLHGQDIGALPPHRRRVNTVFQNYALFPHMTLEANIAFPLENLRWPRERVRERVAQMLDMVGMRALAGRKPAQLSGGQRQRIALARALAPEPEVLLLDEPLSALDLKLRQAMREELRALQRAAGITFVFVTHDQEEALGMSDRICVLGHGEVQQIGRPEEIYEEPVNRFVADFIGETNLVEVDVLLVANQMATVATPFGQTISVPHRGAALGRSAFMSLRPEKIDLDSGPNAGMFEGRIASQTYLGGYTQYVVAVGNQTLKAAVRRGADAGKPLGVGQPVRIGFDPFSARVLAR